MLTKSQWPPHNTPLSPLDTLVRQTSQKRTAVLPEGKSQAKRAPAHLQLPSDPRPTPRAAASSSSNKQQQQQLPSNSPLLHTQFRVSTGSSVGSERETYAETNARSKSAWEERNVREVETASRSSSDSGSNYSVSIYGNSPSYTQTSFPHTPFTYIPAEPTATSPTPSSPSALAPSIREGSLSPASPMFQKESPSPSPPKLHVHSAKSRYINSSVSSSASLGVDLSDYQDNRSTWRSSVSGKTSDVFAFRDYESPLPPKVVIHSPVSPMPQAAPWANSPQRNNAPEIEPVPIPVPPIPETPPSKAPEAGPRRTKSVTPIYNFSRPIRQFDSTQSPPLPSPEPAAQNSSATRPATADSYHGHEAPATSPPLPLARSQSTTGAQKLSNPTFVFPLPATANSYHGHEVPAATPPLSLARSQSTTAAQKLSNHTFVFPPGATASSYHGHEVPAAAPPLSLARSQSTTAAQKLSNPTFVFPPGATASSYHGHEAPAATPPLSLARSQSTTGAQKLSNPTFVFPPRPIATRPPAPSNWLPPPSRPPSFPPPSPPSDADPPPIIRHPDPPPSIRHPDPPQPPTITFPPEPPRSPQNLSPDANNHPSRSPSSTSTLSPSGASVYSAYSYYDPEEIRTSPSQLTPPSPKPPRSPLKQSEVPPRTPSPTATSTMQQKTPPSLHRSPSTTPQTPDDYLQLGIQHHEANRLKESAYCFERSAKDKGGCGVGMLMYGLTLRSGWGVPKDEKTGFRWLRKAAESAVGDLESAKAGQDATAIKTELVLAIYEVGQCFRHGWGIAQDKKMAVSYFEVAAKLGDPDAQQELGFCYANGKGCKKDLKVAAKWYRLAVAQGASDVGLAWIHKSKYM